MEEAYSNDPFHVINFHTLNLMDKEEDFETLASPKFIIRTDADNAGDLSAQVGRELTRAIGTYEDMYRITPEEPVVLKLYPTHDDLSVFALGLPGGPFHGATFGQVIAIDSPKAHQDGSYRWAQTLWRQLGVALIQTVANERAPRWFIAGMVETALPSDLRTMLSDEARGELESEGLTRIDALDRALRNAVSETRRASLLAVGGHLCDFIGTEWGQQSLLDMVAGFASGETLQQVFADHLDSEQEDVEKRFASSLR